MRNPELASCNHYLTENEAAELTRFSRGTLRNMRCQGRGPEYLRIGRSVRYRRDDVLAWLEGAAA